MNSDYVKFANQRQEQLQKAQQVYMQMRPMLEDELRNRLMSKSAIKVTSPIRLVVERAMKSQSSASFSMGSEVIPAGTNLFYDGFELGQLFFTDDNGKEYAVHTGENITVGPGHIVKNTGFVGLLTQTDIFKSVKEQILGQQ